MAANTDNHQEGLVHIVQSSSQSNELLPLPKKTRIRLTIACTLLGGALFWGMFLRDNQQIQAELSYVSTEKYVGQAFYQEIPNELAFFLKTTEEITAQPFSQSNIYTIHAQGFTNAIYNGKHANGIELIAYKDESLLSPLYRLEIVVTDPESARYGLPNAIVVTVYKSENARILTGYDSQNPSDFLKNGRQIEISSGSQLQKASQTAYHFLKNDLEK